MRLSVAAEASLEGNSILRYISFSTAHASLRHSTACISRIVTLIEAWSSASWTALDSTLVGTLGLRRLLGQTQITRNSFGNLTPLSKTRF